ncbi:hypothetical protein ACHAXA_007735 [Cyclostephanos tholiformis]|uniref:Uncharacterized protein n=1 Tax=Cyclostephanos tholiformis TaxID=382380 RepID=A0ABD3RYB6_9STRA
MYSPPSFVFVVASRSLAPSIARGGWRRPMTMVTSSSSSSLSSRLRRPRGRIGGGGVGGPLSTSPPRGPTWTMDRDRSSSSISSSSSSTTTTTTTTIRTTAMNADDATTVGDRVGAATAARFGAAVIPPRPIFPWRSESYPLPRLIRPRTTSGGGGGIPAYGAGGGGEDENDNTASHRECEYEARGGPLGPGWPSPMESWFRGALYLTSMNLLGLSWPRILLPWTRHGWERDIEWAFCRAFSNGVNGMMEDTYRLHDGGIIDTAGTEMEKSDGDIMDGVKDDGGDGFDVDVDISLDPLPLDKGGGNDPVDVTIDNGGISGDDDAVGDDEYNMLQRNLRQLYQSARKHSHPSRVNIVLRTVPFSANIESMFPVFGLSRSLVEDHPNLRHTYRNYLKRLQAKHKQAVLAGRRRLNPVEVGSFVMDGLQEVMEKSAKLSSDGKAAITIVAQVSINCREVFCVRDVESGEIIQGHGDPRPRDVTHLVRFEMIVREKLANSANTADSSNEGDWELEIGRWQITDWDDFLDGNIFFT